MPHKNMRLALVLLLGIVFLAGQLHFCADGVSEPYATHVCPFCATAGSAILTSTPSISIIPVLKGFEVAYIVLEISSDAPRITSPRAPPAL
jgi:hypothetical protein